MEDKTTLKNMVKNFEENVLELLRNPDAFEKKVYEAIKLSLNGATDMDSQTEAIDMSKAFETIDFDSKASEENILELSDSLDIPKMPITEALTELDKIDPNIQNGREYDMKSYDELDEDIKKVVEIKKQFSILENKNINIKNAKLYLLAEFLDKNGFPQKIEDVENNLLNILNKKSNINQYFKLLGKIKEGFEKKMETDKNLKISMLEKVIEDGRLRGQYLTSGKKVRYNKLRKQVSETLGITFDDVKNFIYAKTYSVIEEVLKTTTTLPKWYFTYKAQKQKIRDAEAKEGYKTSELKELFGKQPRWAFYKGINTLIEEGLIERVKRGHYKLKEKENHSDFVRKLIGYQEETVKPLKDALRIEGCLDSINSIAEYLTKLDKKDLKNAWEEFGEYFGEYMEKELPFYETKCSLSTYECLLMNLKSLERKNLKLYNKFKKTLAETYKALK